MKILFLDLDGVLLSRRSSLNLQTAKYGLMILKSADPFADVDWTAVSMVRHLCATQNVSLVLSSAWRESWNLVALGNRLGLTFLDATDTELGERGEQIQRWLNAHPEVTHYAIVDDNGGMLESQRDHFVQTDFDEGLTFADWKRLRDILDGRLGGKQLNALMWEEQ